MISLTLDNFIKDKDKTYWVAFLSDGTTAYQDEDRPGEAEPRAWVRLQQYCKEKNIYVRQIKIVFRSHEEMCPESDTGYFLRRGVLGSFGADERNRNWEFYVVGQVVGDEIHTVKWRIPEIVIEEGGVETRPVAGNEEAIIWNQQSDSYRQIQAKNAVPHTT